MGRLKPLELSFKALLVRLCRRFLKKGRTDFVPLDGNNLHKVLFLRPERIGDMVISLPVFDGLKKHFPHIRISVLGSPRNREIIEDDPRFEKIYLYHKNVIKDFFVLLAMRRGGYDCVVDMIGNDSVTALFLSQLAAPGKPRIGVGKKKYRDYYDFNYDYRLGNTGHIIDNTLKLLTALGIDSADIDPYARIYVRDSDERKAERFFDRLTDGSPKLNVGYNLSAGSPTREWGAEKSQRLIEQILDYREDCRLILITAPSDRQRGEEVDRRLNSNRVFLSPPGMNLKEVTALMARLGLLISPDTSLVHIARSFRVPVVGLYTRYMKNFVLWRPYGQDVGAVVSGNDHDISDTTVDRVFDVFKQVLEQNQLVRQ